MYQPTGEQPEWIELYNPTDSTINLADWEMSDSRSVFVTITHDDVKLPPKGQLVIAADVSLAAFYEHQMDVLVPVSRFPVLNNSGDAVVIRNENHSVVDSVYYETGWGNTPGVSLERNWPEYPIEWAGSIAAAGATPGLPNSSWPVQYDLAVTAIVFEPAVVRSPDVARAMVHVKNLGLDPIDAFELVVFGDWNKNQLFDDGDVRLTDFAGGFLVSGDSVAILTELPVDTAGIYQ
ncbi:lamin tail domain-containing protein, partial [bacterium]|nr:lamin tail domain-containing protein [bacterium]